MPKRIVENESIPEVSTRAVTLEKFRGVDLSSSVTNVAATRSPAAPNMMPSADGFPVKRPGWHAVLTLEGEVHGAYTLVKNGTAHRLVHAGTTLYKVTVGEDGAETAAAVYTEMADRESSGVQLNEKLWLLDGKTYLVYDGETVQPASAVATVPKITIAKAPNGKSGATSYLPVNLLTGKRTDSYRGTEETKAETVYYLSFNALTDTAVTAQVLQADFSGIDAVISMNVTVDTLKSEVFADFLRHHPVPKDRYCIEVTEQNTLLLDDAMRQRLKEFKDLGYSLAVDDFSMGSTSLKYLQSSQFELVKLDGSLVKNGRTRAAGRSFSRFYIWPSR